MKNTFLSIFVIIALLFGYSCQTKKAQNSTDSKSEKEAKVYKDGYELLFKGSGNEPDWNVEVTEDQIVYTNINFPEPMVFKLERTTHIMDVAGIGYMGKNERGEEVFVQVLKEECIDTMADKKFPFSVDVTIANVQNMGQRGCGEFILDERLKKEWFLETFKGKQISTVNEGKRPVMSFNIKNRMLNANMGCNGIGGGYSVMENHIYFNPGFMSTQMYCEGVMELERNFTTEIAGKTMVYSFKGTTLIFKNLNGVELMTFRRN